MKRLTLEDVLWMRQGEGIAARGHVPERAPFFQDHFPGFPVLPGVLSLELLKMTAEHYLRSNTQREGRYAVKKIQGVKFSTFLRPGDAWESRLELVASNERESEWSGKLLHQDRVAAQARLTLELTDEFRPS